MARGDRWWIAALIVVLVFGVVAAVVILPRAAEQGRLDAELASLHRRTVVYLRTWMPLAQGEFRQRRLRDVDGDGVGEFGTIGELLDAGLLEDEEWQQRDGLYLRRGYIFQVRRAGTADADEERLRLLAVPLVDHRLPALLLDESDGIWVAPADWTPRDPIDLDRWRPWDDTAASAAL